MTVVFSEHVFFLHLKKKIIVSLMYERKFVLIIKSVQDVIVDPVSEFPFEDAQLNGFL